MTPVAVDARVHFTPGMPWGLVGAEIRNRALDGRLVALIIGSCWAIPPADGKAVSVSWFPDGRSSAYTADTAASRRCSA